MNKIFAFGLPKDGPSQYSDVQMHDFLQDDSNLPDRSGYTWTSTKRTDAHEESSSCERESDITVRIFNCR